MEIIVQLGKAVLFIGFIGVMMLGLLALTPIGPATTKEETKEEGETK